MEARSHTSVLNSITQLRFPDMQEPNTTKQNAAVRKTGLTSLETLSYLNGEQFSLEVITENVHFFFLF